MREHIDDLALAHCAGELDEAASERVERHIIGCADCRATNESVRLAYAALSQWPAEPTLPIGLRKRLNRPRVAHLGRPGLPRVAALVLLSLGMAGAGYALGRVRATAPAQLGSAEGGLNTYLLLLEEPSWPPPSSLTTERAGYAEWAADLRREGRYVGGEKLTEEPGLRVHPDGSAAPSSPRANISGWFLVRASSHAEAAALSQRGPHLRYGSVLIRQIE